MKKITLLLLFVSIFASLAFAEKLTRFELNDGDVYTGEVLGLENGTYTVRVDGIGELLIDEPRIKQISYVEKETAPAPAEPQVKAPSSEKVKEMANKLMTDKEIMEMIVSLQNDPQFQAVLNDPDILNALKSGDNESLMKNEKFMQLKENPTMKKIGEKATQ